MQGHGKEGKLKCKSPKSLAFICQSANRLLKMRISLIIINLILVNLKTFSNLEQQLKVNLNCLHNLCRLFYTTILYYCENVSILDKKKGKSIK